MSRLHEIFCTLHVAVAWPASGDNAVCYVLLVLWMTLYFYRVGETHIWVWSLQHSELFAMAC